jgi:hypothetical protein
MPSQIDSCRFHDELGFTKRRTAFLDTPPRMWPNNETMVDGLYSIDVEKRQIAAGPLLRHLLQYSLNISGCEAAPPHNPSAHDFSTFERRHPSPKQQRR